MYKVKFVSELEEDITLEGLGIEKFQEDKRQGYKIIGTNYKEVKDKELSSIKEVLKEMKKEGIKETALNLMPKKLVRFDEKTVLVDIEIVTYIKLENIEFKTKPFNGGVLTISNWAEDIIELKNRTIIDEYTEIKNKYFVDYLKSLNVLPNELKGIVSGVKVFKDHTVSTLLIVLNKAQSFERKEKYDNFKYLTLTKKNPNMYLIGEKVELKENKLGYIVKENGKDLFVEMPFLIDDCYKKVVDDSKKGILYEYLLTTSLINKIEHNVELMVGVKE